MDSWIQYQRLTSLSYQDSTRKNRDQRLTRGCWKCAVSFCLSLVSSCSDAPPGATYIHSGGPLLNEDAKSLEICYVLTSTFFPTTQTYFPTYLGIMEPFTRGLGTEGSIYLLCTATHDLTVSHFFPLKYLIFMSHVRTRALSWVSFPIWKRDSDCIDQADTHAARG